MTCLEWYHTFAENNQEVQELTIEALKLLEGKKTSNETLPKLIKQLIIRPILKYHRILLKLSGEALMGQQQYGIDAERLMQYASEIKAVVDTGVQMAVVIGGGNIYRGVQAEAFGLDRVQGDYMGMLATVINSMALQSALEKLEVSTRLLSGLTIQRVCEPYIRRRAVRHLEKGRVVIFGAGIGSPYFTTDSAASLRAIEIEADVVLKGTRVDGIYTADPEKDPTATRYPEITFDEVLSRNLNVMDMTAFTLCRENNLPIIVFDMNTPGNLERLLNGEPMGTLVSMGGTGTDRDGRKAILDPKQDLLKSLVSEQPK